MANQPYTVKTDERWDNVAFKAYGSVDGGLIQGIIEANPNVLITPVIPAGTALNVPVITAEVSAVNSASLPPWLQ